jgi:hypothetical protein
MEPGAAGLCQRGVRPWGRDAASCFNRKARLGDGARQVAARLGPLLCYVVLAMCCDLVEGFGGEDYPRDACRNPIRRSITAASASISRQSASVSMAQMRPAARSASPRASEATHPSGSWADVVGA